MKKILLAILISALLPITTNAQVMVPGGGTGLTAIPQGSFIVGSSTQRMLAVPTSRLVWDIPNSRLGIGTSSPYAALSVFGQTVSSYFTATSTTNPSLFQDVTIDTNRILKFNGFSSVPQLYADADTNSGLHFTADDAYSFRVGGTDRLYFVSTGNVGVGQSNPTAQLDVLGQTGVLSSTGGIGLNVVGGMGRTSPSPGGTGGGNSIKGGPGGTTVSVGGAGGSNTFTGGDTGDSPGSNRAGNNNLFAGSVPGFVEANAGFNNSIGGGSDIHRFYATGTSPTISGTPASVFNKNGWLGVGSSTPGTILSIGSTTDSVNISNTATSTFSKGINITSGCYATNGVCPSTGSGTVGSGTTGQVPYYAANGTTLTATSSMLITTGQNVLFSTTSNPLNARVAIEAGSSQDTGLNVMGNINSFFQGNIQNLNSGASASSDWVATANNGSATTHYIDMGINGSAGGAAPFTTANNAYLYSIDDTLNIGALGASSAINYYTTGGTSPVFRGTMEQNGRFGWGTTSPTYRLSFKAGGSATGIHAQWTDSNDVPKVTFRDNGMSGFGTTTPGQLITAANPTGTAGVVVDDGVGTSAILQAGQNNAKFMYDQNFDMGIGSNTRANVLAGSGTSFVPVLFLARTTGNVGVMSGLADPGAQFVVTNINAQDSLRVLDVAGDTSAFVVDQSGQVGVSSSTPWRTLGVDGTVAFNGLSSGGGNCVTIVAATKELRDAGSANCTTSSQFTKHAIKPISTLPDDVVVRIIQAIRPVMFEYNGTDQHRFGFIAEELEEIGNKSGLSEVKRLIDYAQKDVPVTQEDGSVHIIKKGEPYSVDYLGYTALLTRYVQIKLGE